MLIKSQIYIEAAMIQIFWGKDEPNEQHMSNTNGVARVTVHR